MKTSIREPVPFMGNNGELFITASGSIYKVMYEYEYMYEYYPRVTICDDELLIIDGEELNIMLIRK